MSKNEGKIEAYEDIFQTLNHYKHGLKDELTRLQDVDKVNVEKKLKEIDDKLVAIKLILKELRV